ncbi:glycosyltransferase family 2 protein [bacterium]|nr:glycosyltransferase family 2 protein [bacterium]
MLSVILPIHNVEKYLEKCLESIVRQSYSDIEIVCVNDGSTDNSENIIKSFAAADGRIKLINQPNLGAAAARNNGLDNSRGEYILILDSDDYIEGDALEKMYIKAKESDLDILIAYSYDLDDKTGERILPKYHLKSQYLSSKEVFDYNDIPDYIFNFSVGWAWDKLYKRSFVEKYGLRFPNLQNTEDAYFVFMSLILAKRISVINEALITHRVNNENQLSQSRERGLLCFSDAIMNIKEDLERRNLYYKVEKSYTNWVMEHTVWQYRTAKTPESKEKIREELLNKIYPEFKMKEKNEEFFYDKIAYSRMLEIY